MKKNGAKFKKKNVFFQTSFKLFKVFSSFNKSVFVPTRNKSEFGEYCFNSGNHFREKLKLNDWKQSSNNKNKFFKKNTKNLIFYI